MADVWVQNYAPIGSWPAATALASLPILVLLGTLATGRVAAGWAALLGLATALVVAVGPCGMPARLAALAVGQGLIFALFRIAWLVVAAVFLYEIVVASGQFAIMRASVARLSGDRRIQAVLIAYSFGAFLEGVAGFGAPVAITAAFLVGLGFDPIRAAVLCLIANTAPVAWGSLGIPIGTLATVTGLNVHALSAVSGRILPPIALVLPALLVWSLAPGRATLAVWPALLAIGGSFAATQYLCATFGAYELVDLAAGAVSLAVGTILLRYWRPREEWRFAHDRPTDPPEATPPPEVALSARAVLRAWLPFAILTGVILLWGLPGVKQGLDGKTSWLKVPIAGLDRQIARGEALTRHIVPTFDDLESATVDIVPVSATGTAVFLVAVVSGLILGVRPGALVLILVRTVRRLLPALGAIFAMLALGFVTRSSGLDVILGLAFTRTGATIYPIFAALLGWLGVALTGSDTASNVLFGNLQRITAERLGLSPTLMAAANTTGGVMGKMIDAQSIVVAAAATGQTGREGKILRLVLGPSIALALVVGAIVWVYARVGAWR